MHIHFFNQCLVFRSLEHFKHYYLFFSCAHFAHDSCPLVYLQWSLLLTFTISFEGYLPLVPFAYRMHCSIPTLVITIAHTRHQLLHITFDAVTIHKGCPSPHTNSSYVSPCSSPVRRHVPPRIPAIFWHSSSSWTL